MLVSRKVKVGKKEILAISLNLGKKSLVVLSGRGGYIMCGYLNLSAANKFSDVAVKITGVATIKDALNAKVFSLSHAAKKLGIHKGQSVKDVLKIIA